MNQVKSRRFRVENLCKRFPIVREELWVVYEWNIPVFFGSVAECRDFLDLMDSCDTQSGSDWNTHVDE